MFNNSNRDGQVSNSALRQACPTPFDEGRLWKSTDTRELKAQLQTHFHNITRIMDCVGCDKCKMWGKLQILGTLCCATTTRLCFNVVGLFLAVVVVGSMLPKCMAVL